MLDWEVLSITVMTVYSDMAKLENRDILFSLRSLLLLRRVVDTRATTILSILLAPLDEKCAKWAWWVDANERHPKMLGQSNIL